jgi:hypothetical protein
MSEDLKELEKLTEQIRKLSQERIDKFGVDWFNKLKREHKKPFKEHTKISQKDINIHIKKIEMFMALNNLNQSKACKKIGVSRNILFYLKNGYCSSNTNKILSEFNYEK